MPLFDSFPKTDFHQMNLDFLLKEMKKIPALENTVNEIAGKYNDMYNKVTQLSQMYDSFAEETTSAIQQWMQEGAAYIDAALTNMSDVMDAAFNVQNTRISNVETRMDNLERTTQEAMYMDSPFTGEFVPVQQVIYELASLHMTGAITAGDYDAAELTAAAYDALDLTAYTYDWDASSYIS